MNTLTNNLYFKYLYGFCLSEAESNALQICNAALLLEELKQFGFKTAKKTLFAFFIWSKWRSFVIWSDLPSFKSNKTLRFGSYNKTFSFSFWIILRFASIIQSTIQNEDGRFKIAACVDFRRNRTVAGKLLFLPLRVLDKKPG